MNSIHQWSRVPTFSSSLTMKSIILEPLSRISANAGLESISSPNIQQMTSSPVCKISFTTTCQRFPQDVKKLSTLLSYYLLSYMYDFSKNEELRSFFNVNPELESSQRFILHNREEVISFETMLNKHVETETHLPFRSHHHQSHGHPLRRIIG